jgi:opacity protein-like surface antigen
MARWLVAAPESSESLHGGPAETGRFDRIARRAAGAADRTGVGSADRPRFRSRPLPASHTQGVGSLKAAIGPRSRSARSDKESYETLAQKSCTWGAAILVSLFAVGAPELASAADPIGWYAGAAIGQAQVTEEVAGTELPLPVRFQETHSAFKVIVGLRPVSLVGAEISYMDFGHPSGSFLGNPANASMKGESAFGMFYFPVPIIDVYLKAGIASIHSTVNGSVPLVCPVGGPCGPAPFQQSQTNTGFAGGAGVQMKFGSWAVRAEYERFNAAGDNPYMWSLGLTWSF